MTEVCLGIIHPIHDFTFTDRPSFSHCSQLTSGKLTRTNNDTALNKLYSQLELIPTINASGSGFNPGVKLRSNQGGHSQPGVPVSGVSVLEEVSTL